MRLSSEDGERAKAGKLICHGCFSHRVEKECADCNHYFCLDCYGAADWCLWCEAKREEGRE